MSNGFTLLKVKNKAKTAEDLLPDEVKIELPKYGRVNTLITTFEELILELEKDGFKIKKATSAEEFVKNSKNLEKKDILVDNALFGVLAFGSSCNLSELKVTKLNKLVLQDRASCLPPIVLRPTEGQTILDCCAAPGNKTHQLAQYVGSGGKVLACEADPKRFKLLLNRMELLGAGQIVEAKLQNFFDINPLSKPWCDVTKVGI